MLRRGYKHDEGRLGMIIKNRGEVLGRSNPGAGYFLFLVCYGSRGVTRRRVVEQQDATPTTLVSE